MGGQQSTPAGQCPTTDCPTGTHPACIPSTTTCVAQKQQTPPPETQHFASVSNNIEGFGEGLKTETILLYILIFLIICAVACYIKK